jgi:multidrug efflux pump subunit AcrA (membrane-fusion protein)
VKGLIELDSSANKTLSSVPLGANGSAEIISQESANTLIVPVEAVRDLGDSTYAVFVVGGSGSLALKQVEVGLMDDTQAEIKSGLNAGDVVTTGTVSTSK